MTLWTIFSVKIVEVAIGGQIVELILTEIIRACHSPHSFELPQYRYERIVIHL